MKGFLAEAAAVDLPRLRTKIALVFFRLIPNFHLLKPLKVLCLRAAGARAPLGGIYVKSPLSVEFGCNLSIGRRCQVGPGRVFATTNHRGAVVELEGGSLWGGVPARRPR